MIISCGEALIDMLPRQSASGEDVFLPVAGGALFNTAIALGRLGEDAGFVSGISTDMFGRQLIDALAASKVDTSHCIRSARPTTLAFVQLTDGQAKYAFFDENTAGSGLQPDDLPTLPSDVDALHFGGISLIPEPGAKAYESLLAQMSDKTVISIDPNIRPGFISDEAGYRARIGRMIGQSDIVKVSDDDLDWLAQSDSAGADPEGMARQWLQSGVALVIITRGSDGAQLLRNSGELTAPVKPAQVVDTIGAGDTFNAGFLAGLRRVGCLNKTAIRQASDENLLEALDLANRVAAVTVSRAGANPPWQNELS
ncbi:carbohydrate kinase [Ahrensia sp. R2A130]|uniref:carbohydrate kinase family protein n=1 Tax=Ahrensia sp. R2A130 TaxID=744979 RepID=UPI0001E0A486|nr:carbohydrate kinase [Ahrensia sp. R2A130]EFL88613.1 fructokinase [Ahrensia sp. R2A130]